MEKFEKIDNDQKELVKYWIEKYLKSRCVGLPKFIEKYLTPEPVIEVGKWYKSINPKKQTLFLVEEIEVGVHGFIIRNTCYGFNYTGEWSNKESYDLKGSLVTDFTEATPEEVEGRLIEEAKRRYPIGSKVKCLHSQSFDTIDRHSFETNIYHEVVRNRNKDGFLNCVYAFGKWAEIIDGKAELRETIARIKTELSTLEAQL